MGFQATGYMLFVEATPQIVIEWTCSVINWGHHNSADIHESPFLKRSSPMKIKYKHIKTNNNQWTTFVVLTILYYYCYYYYTLLCISFDLLRTLHTIISYNIFSENCRRGETTVNIEITVWDFVRAFLRNIFIIRLL